MTQHRTGVNPLQCRRVLGHVPSAWHVVANPPSIRETGRISAAGQASRKKPNLVSYGRTLGKRSVYAFVFQSFTTANTSRAGKYRNLPKVPLTCAPVEVWPEGGVAGGGPFEKAFSAVQVIV